jgi:hypothetical protein
MEAKYRFESEVLKESLEVPHYEGTITISENIVHVEMDLTDGEFFDYCPDDSPLETVVNNICKVATLNMKDDSMIFDNYPKDTSSVKFMKDAPPIELNKDLLVDLRLFWERSIIAIYNEEITAYELMAEGYGKIGRIFFPSKKPNGKKPLEAKINFSQKFLEDVPYKTSLAPFTRVFVEKILLSTN